DFARLLAPAITELIVAEVAPTSIALPTSEMVPPVSVTAPSSKVIPAALWVPLTVTLNAPVPSVPAEKTAVFPLVHAAAVPVPADEPSHTRFDAFHAPPGVAPPAPAVVPLISQY